MDISVLREKIDRIDTDIIKLLNERAELASQIGAVKVQNGIAIINSEREAEILDRVISINNGPLPGKSIQSIFTSILEACRNLQINLMGGVKN